MAESESGVNLGQEHSGERDPRDDYEGGRSFGEEAQVAGAENSDAGGAVSAEDEKGSTDIDTVKEKGLEGKMLNVEALERELDEDNQLTEEERQLYKVYVETLKKKRAKSAE